tara:strand:+ start:6894 stop:8189 length:1296 start_codon:yes stop_codon:yes gene_type:complete
LGNQNSREIAILALISAEKDGDYIESALDKGIDGAGLNAPDRRLCRELAFGCVRWRRTLDWLIARRTKHAPKPKLAAILRLGLYQLLWLERVPSHAIVHQSVELAKKHGFREQAGFVNALLRGYDRDRDATSKELKSLRKSQPAIAWSHPDWLVERWQRGLGNDDCQRLLEWNNKPARTFARVNALKTSVPELEKRWGDEGVEHEVVSGELPLANLFFAIKSPGAIAELGSFREGFFYLQDPSTALAPNLLDPKPGERVLDFCAAPGGKTTLMAQLMGDTGDVTAQDQPERLGLIRENCARLEIQSVKHCVTPKDLESIAAKNSFQRVLVDVPCSNTGVMRRRVDLRWRIREKELKQMPKRQLQLLKSAAQWVAPGAALVYSTCSIEKTENEDVVKMFLASTNQFKLAQQQVIHPVTHGVDGAFAALLIRQ